MEDWLRVPRAHGDVGEPMRHPGHRHDVRRQWAQDLLCHQAYVLARGS